MFVLLDENGYVQSYAVVGSIDGGIEVDPPADMESFEANYRAYRVINKKLSTNDLDYKAAEHEQLIVNLRSRRMIECFPYINRGELWYNTLTSAQKAELDTWYHAWLEVTETLVVPEKPDWLI